jgi:arabinogalactan oligomer / maltooligosaccharide transport system permease protein
MAAETQRAPGRGATLPTVSGSVSNYVLRLLGLAVVDTFAVWLISMMIRDGIYPLAAVLTIVTILINIIFLREDWYPLRWMAPGLALLIVMVIYPILFTIYVAFTNYGEGHLLTKQQTISRLQQTTFLSEEAATYSWTAYRTPTNEYALLLQSDDGQLLFAPPNAAIQPLDQVADVGALDDEGIPAQIGAYTRVDRRELGTVIRSLGEAQFGQAPQVVQLNPQRPTQASSFEQRYVYDPGTDAFTDQQTGLVYPADNATGLFTAETGESLTPGYRTVIGLRNFERVLTSPALRGPMLRILLWTFGFAIFSVLLTFSLGLLLAIAFNNPDLKGQKIIRSFLIIPYAIPGVISVLIWRGLLNPRFGPINEFLSGTFGIAPEWFADPTMAKVGILLVNLWLGYPYMMLISSGALAAVPSDIYEAADVDGANSWQKFWNMTMPLILVSLGPLLISSFAFNLNNFSIVYLYAEGGPPISGSPVPAGHTDILISYTYRLAFGGRGADYGFAAAITIFIFLLVATITFFQFRYTKALEEISENV